MSLSHITTCLLCDPLKPKKFVAPSVPEVKAGEQPPESMKKFLQALGMHLNKAHPQAFAQIYQMGAMFQGMLLMKNFHSTDPGLASAAEQVRAFVHTITQEAPPFTALDRAEPSRIVTA